MRRAVVARARRAVRGRAVLPVVEATLPDGGEAVLKLNPLGEPEAEHEPDALAFWDGRGAVRLLATTRRAARC